MSASSHCPPEPDLHGPRPPQGDINAARLSSGAAALTDLTDTEATAVAKPSSYDTASPESEDLEIQRFTNEGGLVAS